MKFNLKPLSQEQNLIPIKMVSVYLAWRVFTHIIAIKCTYLCDQIWTPVVYVITCFYATATGFLLSIFGMDVTTVGRTVYLNVSNKWAGYLSHASGFSPSLYSLAP